VERNGKYADGHTYFVLPKIINDVTKDLLIGAYHSHYNLAVLVEAGGPAKNCLSGASFFGHAFLFLFSLKKRKPPAGMLKGQSEPIVLALRNIDY